MTAVESLELIGDYVAERRYEDFDEVVLLTHKIDDLTTSYDNMDYAVEREIFLNTCNVKE